ncbi:gp58-like family protein, partial [Leuconostoc mesenteroides]
AGILQVGKTYTFSTYVRNTSDTDTNVAPYYEDGIVTPVYTPTSLPAHTDWFRVSITFQCVKDPTTSTANLRWEGQNGLTNGFIQFAGYKLEEGTIATDWTPAPEDTATALAQVKVTADGISKFVRDSSGNISSDFQTALSKTSIITDSTLASSIKTQTSSQISSAITDNNGKIISLINQDSSGVQIAGKNIVLDGDTTVTGDFYAKGGNFKNLNASNLTVGTLNGNQVNITNINANNIVSGAISGANLNINLNTGSVVFQKGRINSSDYKIDVNMDEKYISTADSDTRVLLKGGQMQFIQPSILDLQSSPYFQITNNGGASAIARGASLIGRDNITIANRANANNVFDNPFSKETFSGLYTGYDGRRWSSTKVGGAERGVLISGGAETTWNYINASPFIYVGAGNANGTSGWGNRIHIHAEFLHAQTVNQQTNSHAANV